MVDYERNEVCILCRDRECSVDNVCERLGCNSIHHHVQQEQSSQIFLPFPFGSSVFISLPTKIVTSYSNGLSDRSLFLESVQSRLKSCNTRVRKIDVH